MLLTLYLLKSSNNSQLCSLGQFQHSKRWFAARSCKFFTTEFFTLSVLVLTTIPSDTLTVHEFFKVLRPSISTTQRRHADVSEISFK